MVEQMVTKGYKPEKVLAYFEELCKIPHGSGNEEAVAKYIENFAKEIFHKDGGIKHRSATICQMAGFKESAFADTDPSVAR